MENKKTKNSKKKPEVKVNHHFTFIEAPIEIVGPEVVQWGEASWWPKACSMKFVKKSEGEIRVGTVYHQTIQMPLAPNWDVEITKLNPLKKVERKFLNGLFKGYETVKIEWRYNGTRVDYELHYQINGIHNMVLWPLLYEKLHNKNIKMILDALNTYCCDMYGKQQGQGPQDDRPSEEKK